MTTMPATIHDRHTGRTIHLTHHARHRAQEMHVGPHLIARAALLPDVKYRGTDRSGFVQRCDGSPIAIVFDPETYTVITVLWNCTEDYTRPEKQ